MSLNEINVEIGLSKKREESSSSMKYYAILDTNVLVSAMLKAGSVPGLVALEAMNGDIIPVLNDEILAEYEDVLRRPKFRFEERAIRVFLEELKRRAVYVDAGSVEEVLPDKKDVIFYAVLMEKRKEEEGFVRTCCQQEIDQLRAEKEAIEAEVIG